MVARQLLKAATSVGANYRAGRRGRSRDEFIRVIPTTVFISEISPRCAIARASASAKIFGSMISSSSISASDVGASRPSRR
ncbi:MAG: four helix bundle protein [Acidobacteria bacterium]|nr:four helix bundle protein [Acidobacteriota bacterium]